MKKIYINGFSAICAQGDGCQTIVANMMSRPKSPQLRSLHFDNEIKQIYYFPAFDKNRLTLREIVDKIAKQILVTLHACHWCESQLDEIPIFLASTSFSLSSHEIRFFNIEQERLAQACHDQPFSLSEITEQLKLKWPALSVINIATSCTSGSNALLYAQRYIRQGLIKRALVVGFEAFNSVTLEGFYSLGLLTAKFNSPFSSNSDGLILGEGVGCIAISDRPNPDHYNQFILHDGKNECDIGNITTTDSKVVVKLINDTLTQTGINPFEIVAIKPHATGSPVNDNVEQQSIAATFISEPPLLFFKSYLGHTLGASGVLETIMLLLIFQSQRMPILPHYQDNEGDVEDKFSGKKVLTALPSGYYLLNCLGFGGNNTSLILEITN